jgi:replication fork protection complex subunit Csm3/Swi3
MEATPEPGHSSTNVDDLFDYDVGLEDIQPNPPPTTNAPKPTTGDPTSLGLGLDEEVKVTKKRQPAPKLDEARYALQLLPAQPRETFQTNMFITAYYHSPESPSYAAQRSASSDSRARDTR